MRAPIWKHVRCRSQPRGRIRSQRSKNYCRANFYWPHRGRFDVQFGLIAEGGTVKLGPWSHLAHHHPSQSHLKITPPTAHRRPAGLLENIPQQSFSLRIHAVLLRMTIFLNRLQLARTPTRKCVRERSQPHVGLGPEIGLEIQRSEERLF